MIYLPSDTLVLSLHNSDALIDQLDPYRTPNARMFTLIDFLLPLYDQLMSVQRLRLDDRLQAMKNFYVYGCPHTLKDNPGMYAQDILSLGYWRARYLRDKEIGQ